MRLPIKSWLVALILLTVDVQAQSNNNPQQLPINLKADSGEYDANAGVATYSGNVVITQGEMNLKGDKVVIKLVNEQITTIEAWGKPASFHYVPAKEPPIDGSGQYMKYSVPTSTVEIDKNAHVKQDKNETRADHLVYDLKKENVKGRGVNMTFQPKTK
ncbi:MAG: lipopolysaccharide transport periplasmic protein LptA [Cardiobacteriaceae bacterium]|nr:lipopolysaccharide transport periplasmic protein LptA [Cardiobacteriaceae bacterium]